MRLTTKTRYAVRAMCELAIQHQGKPVSLRTIAQHQAIKPKYLEQIFIKLHKAGLIRSQKGPSGGYFVNRDPRFIKLKHIMKAVGETNAPVFCVDDRISKKCGRMKRCAARPYWRKLKKIIDDFLNSCSIHDLCGCKNPEK